MAYLNPTDAILQARSRIKTDRSLSSFGFFAFAGALEFFAAGFDTDFLAHRAESESPGDTILKHCHVFVGELNYLAAIKTDQVVVVGVVDKIGIVVFLVAAEIDLLQQVTFGEQSQGSVESGARGGGINFACHFPEFLGGEVRVGAEGSGNDNIALPGATQAFLFDESLEAVENCRIYVGGWCFQGRMNVIERRYYVT